MRDISSTMRRDEYDMGWIACDAVAVAVAVQPDIVLAAKDVFCEVEVQGTQTRGMSVFDHNNVLKRPKNTKLIGSICMDSFKGLMAAGLQSESRQKQVVASA